MKELTQELVQSLFDYGDGFLYWKFINVKNQRKIGDKTGSLHSTGYYYIKINNKSYKLHRIIFLYHYGYIPKFIDHIDGDKGNNKIENLREVTRSQNMMNSNPQNNCLSQYKGVCWHNQLKKWWVRIGINNKRISLGLFKSETEAALAYNKAALKYFGEYAKLNEIRGE